MLNHLRQKRLPEEAQTRGLHALAEDEAAKVLGPIKVSLDRVMENQLSEANFHTGDRHANRTVSNWPQPDIPQPRQLSAGMSCTMLVAFSHINLGTPSSQSGPPAATQIAPTVGSLCNVMYSDQASSEKVQDVRDLPYEPSFAQTSLQNRPDLMMSQVQSQGLDHGYIPTESISFEKHLSNFGNTTVEKSAQFNAERNVQVVSQHAQPWGRR